MRKKLKKQLCNETDTEVSNSCLLQADQPPSGPSKVDWVREVEKEMEK